MADTTQNKITDLQNKTTTLTQALSGRIDIAHERINEVNDDLKELEKKLKAKVLRLDNLNAALNRDVNIKHNHLTRAQDELIKRCDGLEKQLKIQNIATLIAAALLMILAMTQVARW